jgi:hypothetical protein
MKLKGRNTGGQRNDEPKRVKETNFITNNQYTTVLVSVRNRAKLKLSDKVCSIGSTLIHFSCG